MGIHDGDVLQTLGRRNDAAHRGAVAIDAETIGSDDKRHVRHRFLIVPSPSTSSLETSIAPVNFTCRSRPRVRTGSRRWKTAVRGAGEGDRQKNVHSAPRENVRIDGLLRRNRPGVAGNVRKKRRAGLLLVGSSEFLGFLGFLGGTTAEEPRGTPRNPRNSEEPKELRGTPLGTKSANRRERHELQNSEIAR